MPYGMEDASTLSTDYRRPAAERIFAKPKFRKFSVATCCDLMQDVEAAATSQGERDTTMKTTMRGTNSMSMLAAIVSLCTLAGHSLQRRSAGQRAQATQPRTTQHDRSGFAASGDAHCEGSRSFQVKFTTTKGDFVVEVTRAWAPIGADRFYNLVKHGFFTTPRSSATCRASSCSSD